MTTFSSLEGMEKQEEQSEISTYYLEVALPPLVLYFHQGPAATLRNMTSLKKTEEQSQKVLATPPWLQSWCTVHSWSKRSLCDFHPSTDFLFLEGFLRLGVWEVPCGAAISVATYLG